MVYYRDVNGRWTRTVLESASAPTDIGSRESICVEVQSNVYVILPGNSDSSLEIVQAKKEDGYSEFKQVWMGNGFDGEPLVDLRKLEAFNVLSVFTRTRNDDNGVSNVVVLVSN